VGAISIDPSPPGWGRAAIPAVGKLSDGTARVAGITLTLGHLRRVSLPSCGQASPGQLWDTVGPTRAPDLDPFRSRPRSVARVTMSPSGGDSPGGTSAPKQSRAWDRRRTCGFRGVGLPAPTPARRSGLRSIRRRSL